MTKKVIGFIFAIVGFAAFIGAAAYAVTSYLNKKKCCQCDEVYDNYVECCCEPDELTQAQADAVEQEIKEDLDDIAPAPVDDKIDD